MTNCYRTMLRIFVSSVAELGSAYAVHSEAHATSLEAMDLAEPFGRDANSGPGEAPTSPQPRRRPAHRRSLISSRH